MKAHKHVCKYGDKTCNKHKSKSFSLDFIQILIQRARFLLSTRCDLDARALESTHASFKT